jgi:hypothetical protein
MSQLREEEERFVVRGEEGWLVNRGEGDYRREGRVTGRKRGRERG